MTELEPPSAQRLGSLGRVATLGMFIIDHFEVKDDQGRAVPVDEAAIGGGGIFATVSARMFLPPDHCSTIIDEGYDFPPSFKTQINGFGEGMVYWRKRDSKTSRALNIYSGKTIGEGMQSFQYLSPQLHLTPKDLILPPSPFASPPPEWVHIVCVTERAKIIADELDSIRAGELGMGVGKDWQAKIIWEPLGRCCRPEELDDIVQTAARFAVFSPNLLETQTILSIKPQDQTTESEAEIAAETFLQHLHSRFPGHEHPAIIVRAGKMGSFTLSKNWTGWVPAYWRETEQDRVVDPTGGGNAWLGGLSAGLLITDGDFRAASIYASAAASFAIQQRGLPVLSMTADGERWNGDDPWLRLRIIAQRTHDPDQRK